LQRLFHALSVDDRPSPVLPQNSGSTTTYPRGVRNCAWPFRCQRPQRTCGPPCTRITVGLALRGPRGSVNQTGNSRPGLASHKVEAAQLRHTVATGGDGGLAQIQDHERSRLAMPLTCQPGTTARQRQRDRLGQIT